MLEAIIPNYRFEYKGTANLLVKALENYCIIDFFYLLMVSCWIMITFQSLTAIDVSLQIELEIPNFREKITLWKA